MSDRISLNPEDLEVTSFATIERTDTFSQPVESWPAVCTCIGICQGTEDLYCSGGCPPQFTVPKEAFAY